MSNSKPPPNENLNEETNGLESIHRVAKIPVIESTINKASDVYGKLKDSSNMVNSILTTAENTMKSAVETAQPVTTKLEGPMKKVDSVLCSGLDYVENKVPAIKLPTEELAQKTKDALNKNIVEPTIKGVCAVGEFSKQTVANITGYGNSTESTEKHVSTEGPEKKISKESPIKK